MSVISYTVIIQANDMKNNETQSLKAVILVGGPGTRLQPLTDNIPKSIAPVLNRPFMEHTLAYLKYYSIEDIILTLSYLPEVIMDCFGDGSRAGVRLSYYIEKEPLGTAGAVKNAEEHLNSTFLVLNGDVFTDLNLADMLAFHRGNKSSATISLQWVDDPSAFGVVETDEEGRVRRFIEKPPAAEATTRWINAGIYILEPEVLKYVLENTHSMFERDLFPVLLGAGKPVYGYQSRGYWMDTGTLEYYYALNNDLLLSKTRSPLIGDLDKDRILCEPDVDLPPSAKITAPVIIGKGCRIGPDTVIEGPAVVGPDCVLESGVCLDNTILWDKVRIRSAARLSRCIIASDTEVPAGSRIRDSVITPSVKKSF
jgi:mannose-1-phosphate guanylyltransferase